ncbi:MAG: hypothetical protein GY725_12930 [bacterium]|nr:hypothetical protein [bacterium]
MNECDSEVKCTLPEDQLAQRKRELRSGLARCIEAAQYLSDGLALRFAESSEMRAELARFIEFEQSCCGFARFSLQTDAAQDALWLEVRGPSGTSDFAKQLVPPKIAIALVDPAAPGSLVKLGLAGAASALFAIVCCATPMLVLGMSAIGFSAATASVALGIDLLALPLLIASAVLLVVGLRRRRATSHV